MRPPEEINVLVASRQNARFLIVPSEQQEVAESDTDLGDACCVVLTVNSLLVDVLLLPSCESLLLFTRQALTPGGPSAETRISYKNKQTHKKQQITLTIRVVLCFGTLS